MISERCSFQDFLDAVRDTSGLEMIYLTNEEATEAERLCFRGYRTKDGNDSCCGEYSKKLKGFIIYLRHGIKMPVIKDVDLGAFKRLC